MTDIQIKFNEMMAHQRSPSIIRRNLKLSTIEYVAMYDYYVKHTLELIKRKKSTDSLSSKLLKALWSDILQQITALQTCKDPQKYQTLYANYEHLIQEYAGLDPYASVQVDLDDKDHLILLIKKEIADLVNNPHYGESKQEFIRKTHIKDILLSRFNYDQNKDDFLRELSIYGTQIEIWDYYLQNVIPIL